MDDAENCVFLNMANLYRFLEEFRLSVELFEFLERGGGPPSTGVLGGQFAKYRIVAARDGALNLYHFACSLKAIEDQSVMSRTLRGRADLEQIKKVRAQFELDFPNIDSVRHVIAHAGEMAKNPRDIRFHEQKAHHTGHGFESGAGGLLLGALYDRTYSVGRAGRIFSVQMDAAAIAKLQRLLGAMNAAFSSPAPQSAPPARS